MAVDLSAQAIPAIKQAETTLEVIPPIRNRWSPRAFAEKRSPNWSIGSEADNDSA